MSARGCPGLSKMVNRKQNQDHQRLKFNMNDKYNPHLTQSYNNFRLKYLETLYSNRASKFMETDSAEDLPTDTEIGGRREVTKPINKVLSETMFESMYTPTQCQETRISHIIPTANKPNTAITANTLSTFYTYGPNNYIKQKPRLPLYPNYQNNGNFSVDYNQCDCATNYRPLPQRGSDPQAPPINSYEDPYSEPETCEWCMREEERRRRQDMMRQGNKYCSCGRGLQGMQYSPSYRPPSRWRPPSRFPPRLERSYTPFIPYSHRHDSKYHQHCKDSEVRGQERSYIEEPWVQQPVRYRRTVPSQRCSPPPSCCRNLPILRRSTIPSRTNVCYR